MTAKEAVEFVEVHGVVLESARGAAPSLAEAVAGERIVGSYWGHAKGNEIYLCTRAVRVSPDVLVCRLVGGKVTYVHRRLWAALARLAGRFEAGRLAAIREVHTGSGRHEVKVVAFEEWVGEGVVREGRGLSEEEAEGMLGSGW